MSSKLFDIVFNFYNFFGMLGLTYQAKSYKVSNFRVILSSLVLLICMISTDLISIYLRSTKSSMFRYKINLLDDFSTLTRITIVIVGFSSKLLVILFFALQIKQRHKISVFMNCTLEMSLDENHRKFFLNSSIKSFTVLNVIASTSVVLHYFSVMKPSLISALFHLVSIHHQFVMLIFVSFVKIFETFIVAHMKQLCQELEKVPRSRLRNNKTIVLTRKYQKIYNLTKVYKRAFEAQTTLVLCCFIEIIVLQVNSN